MTDFDVDIDCTTLERSRSGAITGKLSVAFGGAWFPERQWYDFPVVVLDWWLAALLRLSTGEAQLRFMDGPFLVVLSLQKDGSCKLEGVEDRRAPRVVIDAEVSFQHLVDSIARAAQLVCETCIEKGWSGDDEVRRLQSTLRMMTKSCNSLKIH